MIIIRMMENEMYYVLEIRYQGYCSISKKPRSKFPYHFFLHENGLLYSIQYNKLNVPYFFEDLFFSCTVAQSGEFTPHKKIDFISSYSLNYHQKIG